jgi:hypothetical protein
MTVDQSFLALQYTFGWKRIRLLGFVAARVFERVQYSVNNVKLEIIE